MAGSKTAYLSAALLDHALGGPVFAPPANVFVVVSTAAFDPNATGAACSEVTTGGYGRVQLTNDNTTWTGATAAAPSEKHNVADWTFAVATADWGTPQSVYLADAANGGNLLYGADINNSVDIDSGDTFKVPAGQFILNED